MSARIYSVEYYYTTIEDRPGSGYKFLSMLAAEEENQLAFNAFPIAENETQLIIYPLNSTWLAAVAHRRGLKLAGPHHALIIHGDDELGALARIHHKLSDAGINVASSNGLINGRGGYQYLIHVHPNDYEEALRVLEVDQQVTKWSDLRLDIHRNFEAKG